MTKDQSICFTSPHTLITKDWLINMSSITARHLREWLILTLIDLWSTITPWYDMEMYFSIQPKSSTGSMISIFFPSVFMSFSWGVSVVGGHVYKYSTQTTTTTTTLILPYKQHWVAKKTYVGAWNNYAPSHLSNYWVH